jgi:hypothetical protein
MLDTPFGVEGDASGDGRCVSVGYDGDGFGWRSIDGYDTILLLAPVGTRQATVRGFCDRITDIESPGALYHSFYEERCIWRVGGQQAPGQEDVSVSAWESE